jgi:hypothetical protein
LHALPARAKGGSRRLNGRRTFSHSFLAGSCWSAESVSIRTSLHASVSDDTRRGHAGERSPVSPVRPAIWQCQPLSFPSPVPFNFFLLHERAIFLK